MAESSFQCLSYLYFVDFYKEILFLKVIAELFLLYTCCKGLGQFM